MNWWERNVPILLLLLIYLAVIAFIAVMAFLLTIL